MTTGPAEYAQVYVDISSDKLDRAFTYRIPPALREVDLVGMRVLVPFGSRSLEGYVTAVSTLSDLEKSELGSAVGNREIREIIRTLDREPVFTPMMLALARWMADRYLCRYVRALQCVLPSGIKVQGKKYFVLTAAGRRWLNEAGINSGPDASTPELDENCERVLELLDEHGGEAENGIVSRLLGPKKAAFTLARLLKLGLVQQNTLLTSRVGKKKKSVLSLAFPPEKLNEVLARLGPRAVKQSAVLGVVAGTPGLTSAEAAAAAGTTGSTVQTLVARGLLLAEEEEIRRDPYAGRTFLPSAALEPTSEQMAALERIFTALDALPTGSGLLTGPGLPTGSGNNPSVDPKTFLIHGVTGSGKTEIYLQAIAKALSMDRQAIILVPEISLTPQIVARFKSRFGAKVAVLHSRLSLGERYDEWRRIKENKVDVVVGARSAVFAPLTRLGLIVIDEEHESSYKQEELPRYHAREAAIERARLEGALVILGSATPALETFQRAKTGGYSLISLRERVDNRPLPQVEVVDMRREMEEGNRSVFSGLLAAKLAERLERKEQAIIFLNRRGFSTFVICRECGLVLKCPECDIALTYHAPGQDLRCHYCDHREPNPQVCPKCGSKYIRYFGIGTQRVEEEVKKNFPRARVLRMDVDTTTRKGAHETIINAFQQGDADILVGTQMIAKGLDFPNVTLVGVISADTSLNIPDFRAGERTFQLLTQVAGRAGRGQKAGEVVIQTYSPDHYSIVNARNHDYPGFFAEEISLREALDYPPYCSLVRLICSGRDEQEVVGTAQELSNVYRQLIGTEPEEAAFGSMGGQTCQILGPAPAPLARVRSRYRWHLALKGQNLSELLVLARRGLTAWEGQNRNTVRISIDVEPMSMM